MNKDEFELNELELEKISAGACQMIYRIEEKEDGTFSVFTSSFKGDADELKKLLGGGSVDKMSFPSVSSSFTKLSAEKLETLKKRFNDKGYILVE